MKSYFLEGLSNDAEVRAALSDRLPHWVEPWLLNDEDGDPIAYCTLEKGDSEQIAIQADLSGRHSDKTEAVIGVLRHLQKRIGGVMRDDDDTVL